MKNEEPSRVDLEIVAVIAAAIAAVMDKPHKVISVHPVAMPVPHMNVWAFEGRIELTMSHRIR
jgi:hypothetical protein